MVVRNKDGKSIFYTSHYIWSLKLSFTDSVCTWREREELQKYMCKVKCLKQQRT